MKAMARWGKVGYLKFLEFWMMKWYVFRSVESALKAVEDLNERYFGD